MITVIDGRATRKITVLQAVNEICELWARGKRFFWSASKLGNLQVLPEGVEYNGETQFAKQVLDALGTALTGLYRHFERAVRGLDDLRSTENESGSKEEITLSFDQKPVPGRKPTDLKGILGILAGFKIPTLQELRATNDKERFDAALAKIAELEVELAAAN